MDRLSSRGTRGRDMVIIVLDLDRNRCATSRIRLSVTLHLGLFSKMIGLVPVSRTRSRTKIITMTD